MASTSPLLSIKLENLLQTIQKAKKASFTSASKSTEESYVKLLSVHEVTLEFSLIEARKLITTLAYKHSFITFLKIIVNQRSKRKNDKENASKVLSEFILPQEVKIKDS